VRHSLLRTFAKSIVSVVPKLLRYRGCGVAFKVAELQVGQKG
jgi:hypothetical protein